MRDMFLRIQISKVDHSAQRFLWRGNNRKIESQEFIMGTGQLIKKQLVKRQLVNFIMSSLLFGANYSPCSALYIKDKNARTFESIHPEAVRSV